MGEQELRAGISFTVVVAHDQSVVCVTGKRYPDLLDLAVQLEASDVRQKKRDIASLRDAHSPGSKRPSCVCTERVGVGTG